MKNILKCGSYHVCQENEVVDERPLTNDLGHWHGREQVFTFYSSSKRIRRRQLGPQLAQIVVGTLGLESLQREEIAAEVVLPVGPGFLSLVQGSPPF